MSSVCVFVSDRVIVYCVCVPCMRVSACVNGYCTRLPSLIIRTHMHACVGTYVDTHMDGMYVH